MRSLKNIRSYISHKTAWWLWFFLAIQRFWVSKWEWLFTLTIIAFNFWQRYWTAFPESEQLLWLLFSVWNDGLSVNTIINIYACAFLQKPLPHRNVSQGIYILVFMVAYWWIWIVFHDCFGLSFFVFLWAVSLVAVVVLSLASSPIKEATTHFVFMLWWKIEAIL